MSENVEELEYEVDEGGMEAGGFTARSGEEEAFEEEDQFSLLGSSDDAEKQRMYMEYLALIKDIDCQNKMVADIKAQLAKLCSKDCKTRCEIKNIKRLHNCLEQENLKLQVLINKAIALQNFGSRRHYKPIPIETSFDEDNLLYAGAIPQAVWKSTETSSDPCAPCDPCDVSSSEVCSSPSSSSDNQEAIACQVMKALKKMKIKCPEDKLLAKQIQAAMKKMKKPCKPCRPPCPPPCLPCQPCPPPCKPKKSKPIPCDLDSPNTPCDGDSPEVLQRKLCCIQAVLRKLKEEIALKECPCNKSSSPMDEISTNISKMKKRLCCIQTEIPRLQREISRKERESAYGAPADGCLPKLRAQLGSLRGAVRKIKNEIASMEIQKDQISKMPKQSRSTERLRCQVNRLEGVMMELTDALGQRDSGAPPCVICAPSSDDDDDNEQPPCDDDEDKDFLFLCKGSKNSKAEQMRKLKENYLNLMSKYAKKDSKLKELEQRAKGFIGTCGGGNNDNQAEVELLQCRINELREEQDEFKCIMKEQAQQLEDYRQKYLVAQQKVEEQTATVEKLNMNNKRIEKQINAEVKDIRAKFQEKLTELLQYPKLLENEQCKVAHITKERDDLDAKLAIVCKELRNLKAKLEEDKTEDCRPQLAQCTLELEQTKMAMEELQRQRDLLCEELEKVKDDLDTLRCESAKIIARTKERADQMKQYQQEQIDRLEKELAQCRATACLSVTDREAVIREMQGQLNTLSFSFDAAQKQIKTLRNHIAYVSNDNECPVQC